MGRAVSDAVKLNTSTRHDVDGGVELNGTHKIVGYADDLALLGQRETELKVMVEVLDVEGKKVGLRINREKMEYFRMRRYKNTREERKDLHVKDTMYKPIPSLKTWDVL